MSVWFKRVLFGLVLVLLVAVVGLGIFLLTFNPNAYKDRLETLVHERTARTLTIAGDIGLSLFPRIGLSVGQVSLSGVQADEPFISVDSARFAVAIWPLLSNRLVVDHVALSGVRVRVVQDAEGHFNFDDLLVRRIEPPTAGGGPADLATETAAGAAGAARAPGEDLHVDIAGLDIRDGEIRYIDERTGLSSTLAQINASTGRVTYDQPFEVSFKALLSGAEPVHAARLQAQALLSLNPSANRYEAQKIRVGLEGRLGDLDQAHITLAGNVAWDGREQRFSAQRLEWSLKGEMLGAGAIQGLKAQLTADRLSLGAPGDDWAVDSLSLRASGQRQGQAFELALEAPALKLSEQTAEAEPVSATFKSGSNDAVVGSLGLEGLSGNVKEWRFRTLKLDGAVRSGSRLVSLKLASPLNWNMAKQQGALTALKGDVVLRDQQQPDQEYSVPMIGSVHVDAAAAKVDADLSAMIDGAQTSLKAHVAGWQALATRFALKSERLDLDPWLATPASSEAGPEADSGTPGAAAGTPSPQPADSARNPGFDLAFLEHLDLDGEIAVADLRAHGVQLSKVQGRLQAKKGTLALSGLKAGLYGGALTGHLTASADHHFSAKVDLAKVAVGPLLQAAMGRQPVSGTLGLGVDLNTAGNTGDTMLANLGGRADWRMTDGAVHGVDAERTLTEVARSLSNVLKGRLDAVSSPFDPQGRTPFSQLSGHLDLSQGQGVVSRFVLASNLLRVTEGDPARISLTGRTLDLILRVQVAAKLPKALKGALDPLAGATIPIRIEGPWGDPAYSVRWSDVRNQAVQQVVKTGLMDLLEGRDPLDQAQLPEVDGDGLPAESAPDPVERIGKALKGLLGK